jgi:hypothetical protein
MAQIILNIKSLLEEFSKTSYTYPLMILLNILFLILALSVNLSDKKYRIFILYGVAALLQDMISIGISLNDYTAFGLGNSTERLVYVSIIVFIQIEFIVFYRFFYWQFDGKPIQSKAQLCNYLFISLSLVSSLYFIFFTSNKNLHTFSGYLSATASVLLLIPAFYYFYILFKDSPVKNLLREQPFWIATGITFLHGLNIPLFLIDTYLLYRLNTIWLHLYTINYVAYCFLFALFIIGLLCNKGESRQDSLKKKL